VHHHIHFLASLCIQQGVKHVVICPGSRSAPLVYAFASNPYFTCHSVVDERSAAYIALGMASTLHTPVVLICTSGTAAANFYPAVAEACFQHIPLIVLTADRPQAMLGQQDGQMIDQHQLYGSHVRGYFCFQQLIKLDKVNLKKTLALVSHPNPGPVHINVPLSEPLYPKRIERSTPKADLLPQPIHKAVLPATLIAQWQQSLRKLILIGQWPTDAALATQLRRLAADEETVIIADITSNQFEHNTVAQIDFLLSKTDAASLAEIEPYAIISMGGPMLSKHLKNWLSSCKPAMHIRISWPGEKVDTYNHVTHHIESKNPANILAQVPTKATAPSRYKLFWQHAGTLCTKAIHRYLTKKTWSEPHAMQHLLKNLPDTVHLHLGNSSIIRHAATCGQIHPSWIVSSNRGTSGIDGCTSTALGAAMVSNRQHVLITGDIAFLYDFQPWLHQAPMHPLKVVVMNNGGGRIFEWIDGPAKHPAYLQYFTTPHTRTMKTLMQAVGVQYMQAHTLNELESLLPQFFEANHSIIFECVFNPTKNHAAIKRIKELKL
jgi:2-succinyl-5-enolpyruvyl-6-hydroxy-3-cyclohexene-1-carboxylate synthase